MERVRQLAAELHSDLLNLPELVSLVYDKVIPFSVADQQKQFSKTSITDEEVGLAQPEEWIYDTPGWQFDFK